MFSISMADNVIPYKQIKRNAQKTKIADFTMKHGRDFQSGPRVVKMVLNTQCYQCLWLTI